MNVKQYIKARAILKDTRRYRDSDRWDVLRNLLILLGIWAYFAWDVLQRFSQ